MKDHSEKSEDRSPGMYWLCHHGLIVEWVGDYQERVDYIKTEKKKSQWLRRLKWFRRVQGKLPANLVRAAKNNYECDNAFWLAIDRTGEALKSHGILSQQYDAASEEKHRFIRAHVRARSRYYALLEKHYRSIMRLFRKECPGCPWNGERLVFPGEKEGRRLT